jgi:hypothetical protein
MLVSAPRLAAQEVIRTVAAFGYTACWLRTGDIVDQAAWRAWTIGKSTSVFATSLT